MKARDNVVRRRYLQERRKRRLYYTYLVIAHYPPHLHLVMMLSTILGVVLTTILGIILLFRAMLPKLIPGVPVAPNRHWLMGHTLGLLRNTDRRLDYTLEELNQVNGPKTSQVCRIGAESH